MSEPVEVAAIDEPVGVGERRVDLRQVAVIVTVAVPLPATSPGRRRRTDVSTVSVPLDGQLELDVVAGGVDVGDRMP